MFVCQTFLFLEVECSGIYTDPMRWLKITILNNISNKLENIICLSASLVLEGVKLGIGLIKIEKD